MVFDTERWWRPTSSKTAHEVFHPIGELAIDDDEDRLHGAGSADGGTARSLPHLARAHGWTATDYPCRVRPQHPARPWKRRGRPSEGRHALSRRIRTDPRVREGMQIGLEIARAGALNELGRRADAERGRALERRRRTQEQGRRIGTARAARYRERRERQARALGFASVQALPPAVHTSLKARRSRTSPPNSGAPKSRSSAKWSASASPRRPQAERLGLGRASLAAHRANTARAREARARELGFEDLASYLRARHHHQGWPRMLIAEEFGVTVPVVRKLMKRSGVPGVRGVTVAKARR